MEHKYDYCHDESTDQADNSPSAQRVDRSALTSLSLFNDIDWREGGIISSLLLLFHSEGLRLVRKHEPNRADFSSFGFFSLFHERTGETGR